MSCLPTFKFGDIVNYQNEELISIMNYHVYMGEGNTIHSIAQLEIFINDVNDTSLKVIGVL